MRVRLGGEGANFLFVFRIGPGVHETDGDGFDFIFLDETPDGLHHVGAIERDDFVALIIHALAHADDKLARTKGSGLVIQVTCLISSADSPSTRPMARMISVVSSNFGGDESDFDAAVSDESVGGDGAAMFEECGVAEQFRRLDACGPRRFVNGVHDTAGKSSGVVEALAVQTSPALLNTTTSVNVPPVSTPIMYCAFDAMLSFPFVLPYWDSFRQLAQIF